MLSSDDCVRYLHGGHVPEFLGTSQSVVGTDKVCVSSRAWHWGGWGGRAVAERLFSSQRLRGSSHSLIFQQFSANCQDPAVSRPREVGMSSAVAPPTFGILQPQTPALLGQPVPAPQPTQPT